MGFSCERPRSSSRTGARSRTRALAGIVHQLRTEVDAHVGTFELTGITLAAAPDRVLWDHRGVLAAADRPASSPSLLARRIHIEGELAALVAVNTPTDPQRLLAVAEDRRRPAEHTLHYVSAASRTVSASTGVWRRSPRPLF